MTNPSKVDVVGVGLNATDTLIPVAHYPARGSKVEFRSAKVLPGGQVATAVIACRQWGLRARYVGKIGDDSAAALHRAEFARLGVEAHLFSAAGCPSQQAFILVDDAGERTEALPAVRERFACRLTAATLGEEGVLVWDGARFHYAPAFCVETVDTTGAGDIFHAGFIYGLLQGWPLQRQLDFGCAAAALNCTAIGARGGIPSVDSIERLIATGARHAPAYEI